MLPPNLVISGIDFGRIDAVEAHPIDRRPLWFATYAEARLKGWRRGEAEAHQRALEVVAHAHRTSLADAAGEAKSGLWQQRLDATVRWMHERARYGAAQAAVSAAMRNALLRTVQDRCLDVAAHEAAKIAKASAESEVPIPAKDVDALLGWAERLGPPAPDTEAAIDLSLATDQDLADLEKAERIRQRLASISVAERKASK